MQSDKKLSVEVSLDLNEINSNQTVCSPLKSIPKNESSYGALTPKEMVVDFLPSPRVQPRLLQWYINMIIINIVEFSAESTRGITLPTLYIYSTSIGGDMMFMGLLTSVFSAGRLISSMYLGWLCDQCSFRTVYLVSTGICLLGNVLYIIPSSHISASKHILVISRFLVGFGAGNRSVCRANVAAMTSVNQRLKYITILSAVVFLGYALTPGLGSFTTSADLHMGALHINQFTAPGVILVGINILTLLGLIFVFDDTCTREDAPPDSAKSTSIIENESSVPLYLVKVGVLVFIWLNFTARGVLSVFETINVPLFLQVTQEDPTTREAVLHSSNYQFYLGLAGLITYAFITLLRHHMTDVLWLIIGFSSMAIGNLILCILPSEISYFRLTLSELFIWSIGCPITAAVVVAAFSKILGGKPQGTYMGILGSAGSISRVFLPMLPSVLPSFTELFLVNAFLAISCVVAVIIYTRWVLAVRNNANDEEKPLLPCRWL